ncbi:MAG: transposase [Candidatus Heimdallarchaeota archaeon]|nr:transposase [Candidatus Heimdallarchaeota archaeon]
MVTQTTSKTTTSHPAILDKVMRSYQVVLKCDSQKQREEINQRIRKHEERQHHLLTQEVVKTAVEIYRANPNERYFVRKVGKAVGMNPNIAESAFHWLQIAVKGKIDKEQKVQSLLNFLHNNPQQLVEWMIFGRSPYTESCMGKRWKWQRRPTINILTSSRHQLDSYSRKKERDYLFANSLVFNGALPTYTQQDVVQGLDDALDYQTNAFAKISSLTDNQKAFLNKLKMLKNEQQIVIPFVTSWINSYQTSRWKSLKKLAKELAEIIGKPTRKLLSVVRQVVVFTLFDHVMQSVPQLLQGLRINNLVPLPFKRKNKGRLPVKTMMKKDYVITREGNAEELTRQAKKQGTTTLGFPQMGKKKLSAQVLFPPKVLEYIDNGAEIKIFQVSSGGAPSFKPRVDVVLEGAHDCFRSSKLLHSYLPKIPKGRKQVIGLDINRLGEFMVTFNTPSSVPNDLMKLAERYNHLEKVMKDLNFGFLRKRKEYDILGSCKLKGELNRVYKRRHRLLREITRRLPHFLAAVMVKKKCQTLKIEDLVADPAGTKGALAKAIYTMPDNLHIYKKAVWLASLELGYDIQLESVPPYHTSSKHYGCGGTIARDKGHHDFAPCKKCGHKVNTHENAALNISSLKGTPLPYNLFPSSHV